MISKMKTFPLSNIRLVPLARLELATQGLGIPCSVHTELQGQPSEVDKYILSLNIFQCILQAIDFPCQGLSLTAGAIKGASSSDFFSFYFLLLTALTKLIFSPINLMKFLIFSTLT